MALCLALPFHARRLLQAIKAFLTAEGFGASAVGAAGAASSR
jgi:hypothetical protein